MTKFYGGALRIFFFTVVILTFYTTKSFAIYVLARLNHDYPFTERNEGLARDKIIDPQAALDWMENQFKEDYGFWSGEQDAIIVKYTLINALFEGRLSETSSAFQLLPTRIPEDILIAMPNSINRRIGLFKLRKENEAYELFSASLYNTISIANSLLVYYQFPMPAVIPQKIQEFTDKFFLDKSIPLDIKPTEFKTFKYLSLKQFLIDYEIYEHLRQEVHTLLERKTLETDAVLQVGAVLIKSQHRALESLQILTIDLMRLGLHNVKELSLIEAAVAKGLFDRPDLTELILALPYIQLKSPAGTDQETFDQFIRSANARFLSVMKTYENYIAEAMDHGILPPKIKTKKMSQLFLVKGYPEPKKFLSDLNAALTIFKNLGQLNFQATSWRLRRLERKSRLNSEKDQHVSKTSACEDFFK